MEIKVHCAGLDELKRRIRQEEARLEDLTPFWRSVGMYMVKRTMKCFENEQAPDGVRWQPLSARRIQQRNKRHKGGRMKILTDTGELRRSVAYKAFKSRVIFGSVLKYAAIHQFGGTITMKRKGHYKHNYGPNKRKGASYQYQWISKIPARPFLGVVERDRQKILWMLRVYLNRR